MAVLTVEGIYRDGRVELAEQPLGITESRVMVVFLPAENVTNGMAIQAEDDKERLRQQFLARLRRGVDFGEEPLPKREELYIERMEWAGNRGRSV